MTDKMTRQERLKSLRELVDGVGIDNIPTLKQLGETYGVSAMQISKDIREISKELNAEERAHIGEFINSLLTKFRQKEKQIDKMCSNRDDKVAIKAMNTWLQWSATFLGNLHRLGISVREYSPEYNLVEIEKFKSWLENPTERYEVRFIKEKTVGIPKESEENKEEVVEEDKDDDVEEKEEEEVATFEKIPKD